jgi:hypothetical protein
MGSETASRQRRGQAGTFWPGPRAGSRPRRVVRNFIVFGLNLENIPQPSRPATRVPALLLGSGRPEVHRDPEPEWRPWARSVVECVRRCAALGLGQAAKAAQQRTHSTTCRTSGGSMGSLDLQDGTPIGTMTVLPGALASRRPRERASASHSSASPTEAGETPALPG